MKYLRQFGLILLFSFLGEALRALIPLPVPASIYGMALLFLALAAGMHLSAVEDTGDFLIEIMPVLFIPAGVGVLGCWGELKAMLLPAVLCVTLVTCLVFGVSGCATQALIRRERLRGGNGK